MYFINIKFQININFKFQIRFEARTVHMLSHYTYTFRYSTRVHHSLNHYALLEERSELTVGSKLDGWYSSTVLASCTVLAKLAGREA